MFTRMFVFDLLERSIKTVAQAVLALITMEGVNILEIDTKALISVSLTAGVISILTSIISSGVREKGTASLVVPPDSTSILK